MIHRIGIVGISGYSGRTALEILLDHPDFRVTYVSANNTEGPIGDIWPQMRGLTQLECRRYDEKIALKQADIFLLAVPHTVAMAAAPGLLAGGKRVIDLSGDYRLESPEQYKRWYGADHTDAANLKNAVYGLPELYREKIKKANLVSNPGCYPTASILGLAPLVSTYAQIITSVAIDAKSGVSGAGRKVNESFIFCEVNENFKAYKVLQHQHAPEIELTLGRLAERSIPVDFVPHLLPVNKGILATIYIRLSDPKKLEDIHAIYRKFYKAEPFIRILNPGQQPEFKNVNGTNFCDIGLAANSSGTLIVVTSAIDNLMKGAAGQAVQNLNIMCGIDEKKALL